MSSRYAKSSKKTAPLIITITITLGLGLLLVYDATVFYSQDLYGNPYRFVLLQLVWVVVGSVGFILFYSIHYKKWYKFSPYIFGGAIATLSLLALFGFLTFQTHFLQCSGTRPFVPCINGAYRWLHINSSPLPQIPLMGTLGIQPAELVKLAAILYLSALLSRVLAEKQDPYKVFWRFLIPSGLVFGLVLLQPNMSTASLIFSLAFGPSTIAFSLCRPIS